MLVISVLEVDRSFNRILMVGGEFLFIPDLATALL